MLRTAPGLWPFTASAFLAGRAWSHPCAGIGGRGKEGLARPFLFVVAPHVQSTGRKCWSADVAGEGSQQVKMDAGDDDETAGILPEDLTQEVASDEGKGKLHGGLYLVATPIGNLEDITFRALRVLKSAHRILAEDTRHSRKLLNYYGIQTSMMSYHKFNETARQEKVVQRLLQTDDIIALISDAGTPGISDPGAELVMACIEARVPVYPVPGPSAVITALVASGLSTEEFSFVGFLPAQASARKKRLTIAANARGTQIFYVPPHKLQVIIDDCILAFGGERRCVIARELTKIHEEFWRGDLREAQVEFTARSPRGEVTLLVAGISEPCPESLVTEAELESRIQRLLAEGISPSEASRKVVEETSVRRSVVYPLVLRLAGRK